MHPRHAGDTRKKLRGPGSFRPFEPSEKKTGLSCLAIGRADNPPRQSRLGLMDGTRRACSTEMRGCTTARLPWRAFALLPPCPTMSLACSTTRSRLIPFHLPFIPSSPSTRHSSASWLLGSAFWFHSVLFSSLLLILVCLTVLSFSVRPCSGHLLICYTCWLWRGLMYTYDG